MSINKLKIAFVVQRVGKEVTGGAEALCLLIAEKMKDIWDIEIITTCALDYITWEDYYPEGVQRVNGVNVRRFKVDYPRNIVEFDEFSSRLQFNPGKTSKKLSEQWMKLQGPYSSTLLSYLQTNNSQYDKYIFFTYLYATTYYGLQLVSDKAYLVPTAHDEWPIYLPIFDKIFKKPRALIFSTVEEKYFVEKRFTNTKIKGDIIGVGVDLPAAVSAENFRNKYHIIDPYMLYVGRIDESKGCQELFDFYLRYMNQAESRLKLVLLGKPVMSVPEDEDILELGFVDDQTKYDAISGCAFLVNPSPHESLSMVLLEAWSLNKPTLVTAKCDVMVGQSRRSNSGLWYDDYEEFELCVDYLLEHDNMAQNGKTFVEDNYSWDVIRDKYRRIVGL